MRPYFWPLLFLTFIWLLNIAVLPVFLQVNFVPNLVLAGIVVLAITDVETRWIWLAAFFGLLLDAQSSVLYGSFTLGLVSIYLMVKYIFIIIVPSSHIHLAIPFAYIVGNLVLQVWIWILGIFAGKLGWPVWPSIYDLAHLRWWMASVVGGGFALLFYIVWLEILHRLKRPIRM